MLGALGEAALRTLLLAITAQFGLWILRVRRAQMLLATWTLVLVASLAMPALQWATPLRLSVVPAFPAAWSVGVADLQSQTGLVMSKPVSAAAAQRLPATGSWLEAAYLLVSGFMVLRLMVGVALSFRLLRKSTPIRLTGAPDRQIRISREVATPVTVGSVILLPPGAVDWPAFMQQAAIAHECAHVARRDFVLLVLSQFNRALFWFSPVSWLLHRQLAALAEHASDDDAMKLMGDRTGYAEVLLEMGRRSGRRLHGLAMARTSTLRHRIERVLSNRVETAPATGLQRSMIVVGIAVATVVAAGPDFNPAAPPGQTARGRPTAQALPALALSDNFAPRAITAPLAQSPIEDAPQSAAPISRGSRAAPQQLSIVPVAARPVPRPVIGNVRSLPPIRGAQAHSRASASLGDAASRRDVEAVHLPRSSPASVDDADHTKTSQRESHPPASEPSLLKVIDQQTCNAVYLPSGVGGGQSGWGSLNIVRAKFFRAADGMPWLKFYLGTRDPVNLPVTVTGKEVEFTAAYNTSFKMLPEGTNHLTGTTQRPYGTIDFACGEAGANLFDRKS